MAGSIFDSAGPEALASALLTGQEQRAQVAQYAILRASTYLKENKSDEALREFKKALVFDPQNTTARQYIGKIYQSQGNTYEAIKVFKDMVRLQPDSVDAHIDLGNTYLQAKQYAESEKEFKTAAKLDPQNPLPNYTLGLQYVQTDRLAEAESMFRSVEKISPKDGNVFYSLGVVYNKQGKYDDAAANLEKALTLKKNLPAIDYELGIAYNGSGRTEDAQKQLTILKSSDTALAQDLKFVLEKPQILTMDTTKSGGFTEVLRPNTPLWMLDPQFLAQPNSSKAFSVTFTFSNNMDFASITNTQNWNISRANSTEAGYYNNTMPLTGNDVTLPSNPESVIYNALTREATITFRLSQNADGTAVIDPSHIVFSFKGVDAAGREMDITADAIDGYTGTPF